MQQRQVPEIREADAPPEIAALYREIRAVLDVPVVNLIHRYLATVPGALPWAWSLARGALLDGRLDRSIAGMLAEAGVGSIAIARAPRADAAEIVEAYNRGNRRNAIVFAALEQVLRGDIEVAGDPFVPLADLPAHPRRWNVPVLPKLFELDAPARASVLELIEAHGLGETGIVPSMYLHLAAIPGGIDAVREALLPPARDGTIARYARRVGDAAARSSRELVPPGKPRVPEAVARRKSEIADTIAGFVFPGIPTLIVAGDLLSRRFN